MESDRNLPDSSETSLDETHALPIITVAGYIEHKTRIDQACHSIFGYTLTPEDLVDLIAAPPGAELVVEVDPDGESIGLKLRYTWSNGTHDYLIYLKDGMRIVEIEHIRVREEAPDLIGTTLFAQQVNSFRNFGINEIRLQAIGYPGDPSKYGGYYFWARVGFLMSIGSIGARLIEAGFDYVDNTLDLFAQPGGPDWWYNHGSERSASFYLDEDSPCIQALQIYLEEKGVNINVGKSEETNRDPG